MYNEPNYMEIIKTNRRQLLLLYTNQTLNRYKKKKKDHGSVNKILKNPKLRKNEQTIKIKNKKL